MLAAEMAVGIGLRGLTASEAILNLNPVSGTACYLFYSSPPCPGWSPAGEMVREGGAIRQGSLFRVIFGLFDHY
jgi:hypothetical protein